MRIEAFGALVASKYLNEWCKRLNRATEAKDFRTISELTESILSPDERRNPIRLAINIDYEYVILDIVRALKQVEGLDALRIAQLLILCSCPIKNVISQQSLDVVEHMIRLGSPVNETADHSRSIWRSTALHSAVAGGDSHLRAVKLLLDNGADLHQSDSLGYTPLHRCLEARHCLQVLRALVERGARANTHDVSRTSALVTAIRHDQPLEVVRLLVQGGADVMERDVNGCAALHYAGRALRRDLVDYLLELGVDPNFRSQDGEGVLFFAFGNASLEFLRHLVLVCGADLNLKSKEGNSLLHVVYGSPAYSALRSKRDYGLVAEKIRFCLLRGADINARGRYGSNVLQLSMMNHENWLDVLLEHVAVREFMDLPVDRRSSSLIYSNDFCLSYLVVCKIELVALMDLRFYNDVTMFNILTDGDGKMMAYMRNDELVAAFQKISGMQLFLIYSASLSERFNHFLEMHRMRQRAVKVLGQTLSSVLDYTGVQEIVKYLSNRDLLKLSGFSGE